VLATIAINGTRKPFSPPLPPFMIMQAGICSYEALWTILRVTKHLIKKSFYPYVPIFWLPSASKNTLLINHLLKSL
jgi:hypothetical protein